MKRGAWSVKREKFNKQHMVKSELFAFEKLKAYKYARALVRSVYKLIRKLPYEEKDALRDQLQRAVISVPSNIAEGMGRKRSELNSNS